MDLLRRMVNEWQECLKWYLRVSEYLLCHAVHEICVVISKNPCYMQPLAVMAVRLINPAGKALRQRVDCRYIVYIPSLYETRNTAPVINELDTAE